MWSDADDAGCSELQLLLLSAKLAGATALLLVMGEAEKRQEPRPNVAATFAPRAREMLGSKRLLEEY